MNAKTLERTRNESRTVALALVLTVCGSSAALGQMPSCAAKTAKIQTGAMDSIRRWADESFAKCTHADRLIGQLWATTPADEVRLAALTYITHELLVRRVYDTLMAVATRPAVPLLVREYAIAALLPWAAPRTPEVDPTKLLASARSFGSVSAASPFSQYRDASAPSPSIARAQLVPWLRTQFVDAVAQTTVLREVGIGALQTIANEVPGAIRLGASDLEVTWTCGQEFRIINRMRVLLPYEFRIGESGDARNAPLRGVPLTRESDTLFLTFRASGPLRVYLASTQVREVTVPTQPIACPSP